MKTDYDFLLWARAYDPDTLRRAALAHEDADTEQTFLTEEGTVDVNSCLVMLLDPGHLQGCDIQHSGAAQAEDGRDDDYEFGIWLTVHDPAILRAAALEHEDAQPDDTFLASDGSVDVEACLVMVLDPGSLPGCSIQSSSASPAGALLAEHDLDHAEAAAPRP